MPVVLPTDTVYGIAARADEPAGADAVYRLKGREARQPTALLAASLADLLAWVPELPEPALARLLPGPFTLVLRNSARRFPWLTGDRPDAIGVRVPDVAGDAADFLEEAGAVAATSANLHGGLDPHTVDEVPEEILSAVAAVVDGGELPGVASTVIDFTGPDPKVIREGAVPAAEAIDRVFAALR